MESIEKHLRKDIRSLTETQLKEFLLEHGEQAFRTKQILQWIWQKSAFSFDQMTNLSLQTRELLKNHFEFRKINIYQQQKSNDGTIKVAFKLYDNHFVEGVLIPTETRMTACISSQVGCSLTCKFCATGYMGRKRNLEAPEIYDQVVAINQLAQQHYQKSITNIVFMGMGEPLLNYANVLKAIHYLTSPDGLQISPKRITVSTAGIAKMIHKLADDKVKFNLALSLHAANDEKRNQIMPINESNSLKALKNALLDFYLRTKNEITYEYILFEDFNDSLKDAEELYQLTKHYPVKINIIQYNPIRQAQFRNASEDKVVQFTKYLAQKGINVRIRRSRGKDIDAACGQLANQSLLS
ncbi:MAG: 23S rRNA (adenine(2503)-C(2))-methyltransferase RlmN [Cytophagales bacterium]|nr:23S rRNA (adenine(2503)-C(2))-methyltransferase RlmN [Cytophagales bacterium]MDW8383841.1 23S rRNA (adenine(2503)-C(2))-methyltransferase RlmN [Flammeovirgaceae bacterium]